MERYSDLGDIDDPDDIKDEGSKCKITWGKYHQSFIITIVMAPDLR